MNIISAMVIGLINFSFDIFIYILLFRFLLQLLRADYYSPFTLWIMKLSNPVIMPLQKMISAQRNISFAALIAIISFEIIKILVLLGISHQRLPINWLGVLYWSAGDLLQYLCNIFFYVLIIQAIFSWFRPYSSDWMAALLYRFTQPLLRPIRKILPPLGGLDLSPLPWLFLFKFLIAYVCYPLISVGMVLV